jgi:hypothetical protein
MSEWEDLTEEQKRQATAMHHEALSIGYNEMVKMAPTLGQKVFYRVAREQAAETARSFGSELEWGRKGTVGTLRHGSLHICFLESDIEAMRDAVAKWDARPVDGDRAKTLVTSVIPTTLIQEAANALSIAGDWCAHAEAKRMCRDVALKLCSALTDTVEDVEESE